MIDSQLVCPRGGHGPSSVVDSIGVKAYALMPVEAGAMRRAQAPIRGCSSWGSII
jgi:hypothetical protein